MRDRAFVLDLQLGSDRPDVAWPQRRLGADELALVEQREPDRTPAAKLCSMQKPAAGWGC